MSTPADTYQSFYALALAQGWSDVQAHRYALLMVGRTHGTTQPTN